MRLPIRTAALIAWRETRSSTARFVFVVLAVAAGVGALAGVRGFSESVRTMLHWEARTIMAADLTARQFSPPTDTEMAALDALAHRGVDRTQITETVSMASTASSESVPVLVSLKAVDPSKYPYYGEVKLDPPMPLAQALTADTIAAGEDVLIRLGLKTGQTMRLGGQDFRVSAIVVSEPDRMSGTLNIGLRVMLSRDALERTGLMQIGSRAAQRYLFKIEAGGPDLEEARAGIREALPESLIADANHAHPLIARGLDQATVFLSLVSLIALIVGAIGVGMAMHAHLQQKMDHIAVMKSLGGTSGEIIRIFLLQTMMLGLAGGVLGVVVGRLVEQAFPALLRKIFWLNATITWHPSAAAQGILVGVLTTLLFTLPPLLNIRKIRPAVILRRDMPDAKLPWKRRIGEGRASLAVGGVILAGIGGIAAWLANSPRVGGYFAGGLAVSLAVLAAVAWVLLRTIRGFLRGSFLEGFGWRIPALARQGLANLQRQGNQAQAILVALGLGVMFTLSVYLIQKSLVTEILQTAPPGVPNVYLVGVTPAQTEPLKELIAQQEGVLGKAQLGPSVAARLISVDGELVADRVSRGLARRYLNTRSVTWEEEQPFDTRVTEGAWWKRGTTEPVVAVADDVAKTLDIKPGSVIEMESTGHQVRARVVTLFDVEAVRYTPTADFVFNPPALAGLPVVYYGGVRMKPSAVGALQRAVYAKFPTITVVNIADALEIVQQVVDQIALVIRFLSAFAILAGAIILAASVAGTRFRRVREVVILKTLGATRRHVSRIFSIEFLTLGAVAGLIGSVLASAFSGLVLQRLLDAKFHLDITATLVCIVLTALLANASGWIASFRILGQKPLEALREE
jgi:putative ABC transport system permease protein